MSIDKVGNNGYEEEVTPFHSHQQNLDDLENVEGFNNKGGKDVLYGFKLKENGIYERAHISISDDLKLFDENNVKHKTPLNLIYYNSKWKLIPAKHEWDIDLKVVNNAVSCKGDTTHILRMYNSGTMLGNLVPQEGYEDIAMIMKHGKDYCLGASADRGGVAMLDFIPKLEEEIELLTDAPVGSTFLIEGILLKETLEKTLLIRGLEINIAKISKPTEFRIILRKKKENFEIDSFPPNHLDVHISGDRSIQLNSIKIVHGKYCLTRIAFTTDHIRKDEVPYL